MFEYLGKIYPSPLRRRYKTLMKYCDIDMNPDRFIGMVVTLGLVTSFIVFVGLAIFLSYPINLLFILFLLSFALVEIIGYLWLLLRADAKGKLVEDILPDALLLMSMNIKSGMTTDRALVMSARYEFGPLAKELGRAGKQILAGKEIRYALIDMTTRIKSPLFDRTMRLIVEGIESGGELSSLLRQTAEDIQNTKLVSSEVRSNLLMYAIFIFFAIGFGSPLLFGISTYLVGSIGSQFSAIQMSETSQFSMGLMNVKPDFLVTFALIELAITSIFGGLIIGVIKGGNEKTGIKFIPILIAISFTVFFIVRTAVSSVFPTV